MSIRDYPSSTSWFLTRFAGLQLVKSYDPSTGGVDTGDGRLVLPPWWVQKPTLPSTLPPTPLSASLVLWFDGSRLDTVTLDEDRNVLTWRDLSGFGRNATRVIEE